MCIRDRFSIILISFIFVFSFIPPLDYLPDGNRNFVFARIIVPPGYNKNATLEIARAMEKSNHCGKRKLMLKVKSQKYLGSFLWHIQEVLLLVLQLKMLNE